MVNNVTYNWPTPGELADALESGDWKKTKNALVRDGGYCCLGVCGRMAGLADGDLASVGLLTDVVVDNTAIADDLPAWLSDDDQRRLAELNDDYDDWSRVIHALREVK